VRALKGNTALALVKLENTLTTTDDSYDEEQAALEAEEEAKRAPPPRKSGTSDEGAAGKSDKKKKGGKKGAKGGKKGKKGAKAADDGAEEETKAPVVAPKRRKPTLKELLVELRDACSERRKLLRVVLQYPELTEPIMCGVDPQAGKQGRRRGKR